MIEVMMLTYRAQPPHNRPRMIVWPFQYLGPSFMGYTKTVTKPPQFATASCNAAAVALL